MSSFKYLIPKLSDDKLVSTFVKASQEFKGGQFQGSTIFNQQFAVPISGDRPSDLTNILKVDSQLILQLSTQLCGMTISFQRLSGEATNGKSAIYDQITVNENSNGQHQPEELRKSQAELVGLLTRELSVFEYQQAALPGARDEVSTFTALHMATLERLEALNVKLAAETEEYRRKLEEKHDQKIEKLEAAFQSKGAGLTEEFAQKQVELKTAEDALKKAQADFDARHNTFVRRDIRTKISSELKDRLANFDVTTQTSAKRGPVEKGLMILALVSLAVFGVGLWEIDHSGGGALIGVPLWITVLRTLVASAVLFWSLFFYVRWNVKWADQHAEQEFALRQFFLDINRADFAVETSLEYFKETETVLPDLLQSRLTENMFQVGQVSKKDEINPADALASALLGSSSAIKLKAGENEISFDKPSKIPGG